jgi:hypothetical protein
LTKWSEYFSESNIEHAILTIIPIVSRHGHILPIVIEGGIAHVIILIVESGTVLVHNFVALVVNVHVRVLHRLLQDTHALALIEHVQERLFRALGPVPRVQGKQAVDRVKGLQLQLQVLEGQRLQDAREQQLLAFIVYHAKYFLVAAGDGVDHHEQGLFAQIDVSRVCQRENPLKGVAINKLLHLVRRPSRHIGEAPKCLLYYIRVALIQQGC